MFKIKGNYKGKTETLQIKKEHHMKNKIFCFNNGGADKWYTAVALAEDGTAVASHICSHECYMMHDLGLSSTLKHDLYNQHYGEGNWELEWVQNPKTHEGLMAAFAKNQEQLLKAEVDKIKEICIS